MLAKFNIAFTDTDECASDPCQNGATCNDMVNMYNCTCAPGYEDVFCENGNLSSSTNEMFKICTVSFKTLLSIH